MKNPVARWEVKRSKHHHDDPDEGHKPKTCWSDTKIVLHAASVAGVLTSPHFFLAFVNTGSR